MRKYLSASIIIFFSLLLLFFAGQCYLFFRAPLVGKSTTAIIKIYPRESIETIAVRLKQAGITRHPSFFAWIFTLTGNHLHFGEYQIRYPLTAWGLMKNMSAGIGLVKHKFTIVEGWTLSDVQAAMAKNSVLMEGNTLRDTSGDKKFSASERWLYPSTYFFLWGNNDQVIYKTAYEKMQSVLNNAWISRDNNVPYQTPYQALIAASLIERETALTSEKPVIASVVINRLAQRMPLQVDPTVLYGLKKSYGSGITKKDLRSKTPFNTYVIRGLPPTPICMPSESSVVAALHPASTDYLYYVADGTGGHVFSRTYQEHLKNITEIRAASRRDASGRG